jgi:hypothetical protein
LSFRGPLLFSDNPDPRFAVASLVAQHLASNYYEIGNLSLTGDLFLLVNSNHILVHTGIPLAGDVVYTKKGTNLGQPWVLMREKDMIGLFSALEPVNVRSMRWNKLSFPQARPGGLERGEGSGRMLVS